MPSTMSKHDDDWSVETPPRKHTTKRQKTETDVKIKVSYPKNATHEDYMVHILLMQAIMAGNDNDINKYRLLPN